MQAHTLHKGEQAIAINGTPNKVWVDLGFHRYQPERMADGELVSFQKPGIPEYVACGDGYVVFDRPADADISVFVE